MLGPEQRLRRSGEFAAAVRRGRRAARGAVLVHLQQESKVRSLPREERERDQTAGRAVESSAARAGFVVSKAVGPAVVRNKVRRRLRHLVRERLTALPPGTTLVVRALPDAAIRSYAGLAADLDAALAAAREPRKPGRRSR